jgi:hypothetical protein
MPGSISAGRSEEGRGVIPAADEHLSDLTIERWIAGELSDDGGGDEQAIGRHLSQCATCQARHRRRSDERSAFAVRPDLVSLAEATRRRAAAAAPRSWSRARSRLAGGLVAAAAAGVSMVLVARGPAPSDVRTKGGLELELFVRHPDGIVAPMLPDASVAPGDRLRFRVGTAHDGYVGIVSIDGAHGVTSYVPPAGPLPAVKEGRSLLDGAVELDGVLGGERLFAFLCAAPLDAAMMVAGVRSALESSGGDPARLDSAPVRLPCAVTSFGFRKVPRS